MNEKPLIQRHAGKELSLRSRSGRDLTWPGLFSQWVNEKPLIQRHAGKELSLRSRSGRDLTWPG
ncbi:hypothetical protein CKJ90_33330, partial [Klebsiella pneumoniae]